MKKSYFELELEIVKFSFSDAILKIKPSGGFNVDPTEDNMGEDVGNGD